MSIERVNLFLQLLWGSVVYRPYVYVFFACFLVLATYHLGWKRMLTFMVSTFLIAFASEYSSTRNGIPFGPYTYIDASRNRELWIANIPVWDSLSFVFLSYFSFVLAAGLCGDRSAKSPEEGLLARLTPWVGGLLMMLLDVVIDPVALQGDKWFLGKIYYYPYHGFYFGVTAANFAGWFVVGFISQRVFQVLLSRGRWCRDKWIETHELFPWGAYLVYAGILLFNLWVTIAIHDRALARASSTVIATTLSTVGVLLYRRRQSVEIVAEQEEFA